MQSILPVMLIVVSLGCSSPVDPCERIAEIEIIPMKDDAVDDEVYNALIEAGDAALPCLIEQITNDTKMKDPRQAPPYPNVTVGDVSHFVLVDITGVPFEAFFPDELLGRTEKEGVYAYFDFVKSAQNRVYLQEQWSAWLKTEKGIEPSNNARN